MANCKIKIETVGQYHIQSDKEFASNIQTQRKPCVLQGLDIGECVTKWTPEYLSETVGPKPVKILAYHTHQMSYFPENYYLFKTLPFNELVKRCNETHHENYFYNDTETYYLRAIGFNGEIANLHKHFPEISNDIKFPNFFTKQQFHSSTLRIASKNFQVLTHYDTLDNILLQVRGKKRVVLFEPRDYEKLYPGDKDKSRIRDIDDPDFEKFPKFADVTHHEAFLNPGDVLFIPSLWYHSVKSLEPGVSVNIFWKNLDPDLYKTDDPFGNHDLIPVSDAINSLKQSMKRIENLPLEWREYCKKRMVDVIKKHSCET